MKIRLFRKGDEQGIIKMIDKVMSEFGEHFDPVLDRDLLNIPKYYRRGGAFWVLVDGDKIVGSVAVSRVNDEICKFRRFYVDSDYRGKGFGSKLFNVRLKFAKEQGYKNAWLATSVNHKDIIIFIKKKGARRTRKILFPTRRAKIFFVYDL